MASLLVFKLQFVVPSEPGKLWFDLTIDYE